MKNLKTEILKLLETSHISDHQKRMVRILLPCMDEAGVQKIYDSLQSEQAKLQILDEKRKRAEFKYNLMTEKLGKMEAKK